MKVKHLFLFLSSAFILFVSCGGGIGSTRPKNALDSVSYAIGVNQGAAWKIGMKRSNVELNDEMILAGVRDALSKDSLAVLVKPENAGMVIESFFDRREKQKKKENLENGRKFLAENAKKAGVETTASGLQYIIEREGTGVQPRAYDTVEVSYRGLLIDGKEFESSYTRNKPAKIYLKGVIKGWTEGIQLMREGAKYKFFLPTELAYGEYVYPNSPFEANVPLIFEIELLNVIPGKAPAK
ncbi:MAG: FKBP-type peptidyl-prolyl cis-trans isomerase [Prevotellaceae bacterium]|jgi:FKBP-type peptidyl-prolyl cis-trans isomerase|nr:FKBP-type peptidyl-prolyl cis-trans isomerase [Prevotellaceae bacterium]